MKWLFSGKVHIWWTKNALNLIAYSEVYFYLIWLFLKNVPKLRGHIPVSCALMFFYLLSSYFSNQIWLNVYTALHIQNAVTTYLGKREKKEKCMTILFSFSCNSKMCLLRFRCYFNCPPKKLEYLNFWLIISLKWNKIKFLWPDKLFG